MSKPTTSPSTQYLPSATSLDTLMARNIELDFVLPGFLLGTVGALVSPGGIGKSYWALALALDIAGAVTGDSLTGLKPSRGRIVLLSAEDTEDVLGSRLQAIGHAAKGRIEFKADAQAQPNLDHRNCVGLGVDIMADEWFSQLCAVGMGARLIVLDTLRRFHTLDENSTQDMTRVLGQLERMAKMTGASILYLHHPSKAAVLNGQETSQQAARGASVLVDNARWVSFLAVMTEGEARLHGISGRRERYVRWNISKQNYGASQSNHWYWRDERGVLIPQPQLSLVARSAGKLVTQPMQSHGHPDPAAREGNWMGAGAAETPHVTQALPPTQIRSPRTLVGAPAAPIPSATNAYGGKW